MPFFNTANAIDYSMIALYFAVVVWVGLYSARKNRNTADYFRGGGKIPWALAGISNWVAGFSAFMFVAAAGFTYNYGIIAVVVYTSAFWAYIVGYFTFSKMWRRARINSPLEFLTRRFSPSTTYFYSVTSLVPQVVGIGQGLYIVCLFVTSVLGFAHHQVSFAGITLSGFQVAVIVVGTIMVFYTAIGGLWAAVLSDTVQCIILAVMSMIVFLLSYRYLGHGAGFLAGVHRLRIEAPPQYFRLHGVTGSPVYIMVTLISGFLGYNVNWAMVQRYHSVADERGAQKMALLCACLSLMGPLLWILPVMAARVIFPDMHALWPTLTAPEEASFVSLALLLLPHGMLGFVVSAILSAALGQANDIFNWLSATVTHDLYVPWRRWRTGHVPSDKKQMRVAHLSMVLMGACGVSVAFYIPRFGGAFKFALIYYSLVISFSLPVALGMLFRRTPWWAGIVSCSAAIVTVITLIVSHVWEGNVFEIYERNILGATIAAVAVFAVSSFWYREDDPRNAGARELDANLKIPVIVENEAALVGGSLRVYGLVGAVSALLGLALVICAFLPAGGHTSPKINAIAGVILLALGALLWKISRRAVPEPART
jgi:solute:Na+ symporter, SSS family